MWPNKPAGRRRGPMCQPTAVVIRQPTAVVAQLAGQLSLWPNWAADRRRGPIYQADRNRGPQLPGRSLSWPNQLAARRRGPSSRPTAFVAQVAGQLLSLPISRPTAVVAPN